MAKTCWDIVQVSGLFFPNLRGSSMLLSWSVNGHFIFAWIVNMDFFPCFINLYFPSSGTGFLFFSWSVKYALNFAFFFKPTTIARKNSHLFGDFSVIKARKLHQIRSKTCLFETLSGGGLRPNHSDSEPGGPRVYNYLLGENYNFGVFAHTSNANTLSPA